MNGQNVSCVGKAQIRAKAAIRQILDMFRENEIIIFCLCFCQSPFLRIQACKMAARLFWDGKKVYPLYRFFFPHPLIDHHHLQTVYHLFSTFHIFVLTSKGSFKRSFLWCIVREETTKRSVSEPPQGLKATKIVSLLLRYHTQQGDLIFQFYKRDVPF